MEKKYPRGLDNSGNIEGNSNGLFQRPGAGSATGRPQAAGRLTRRSCPALGAGQHARRGWGSRGERPRRETVSHAMANAVGSTAGLQQTHPDVEHASKTGGAVQRPGEPRDRDTPRQPHQSRTRGDAAAAPVWGSNDSCPRWPPACPRPGMRTKWRRTKRRLRRSRRAWPNIWRLSILRRSMCPSTGLVDQGKVPPALTAA
jgi:hypothetical protein